LGKTGEEGRATAHNIAPNEFIKLGAVGTLSHLVEPTGEDSAISCCRTSRLFKRRWGATPATRFCDLSCLSRRYPKCRSTNVHNLTLRTRRNKPQFCDAAPDQRNP
jgi:hypothetical protein